MWEVLNKKEKSQTQTIMNTLYFNISKLKHELKCYQK